MIAPTCKGETVTHMPADIAKWNTVRAKRASTPSLHPLWAEGLLAVSAAWWMLVTGPISRWCKILTLMAQSAAVECDFSLRERISFSWSLVSGAVNAYVAA